MRTILILLIALILSACGENSFDSVTQSEICYGPADCRDEEICYQNRCITTQNYCETLSCSWWESCNTNENHCELRSGYCDSNSDCLETQHCSPITKKCHEVNQEQADQYKMYGYLEFSETVHLIKEHQFQTATDLELINFTSAHNQFTDALNTNNRDPEVHLAVTITTFLQLAQSTSFKTLRDSWYDLIYAENFSLDPTQNEKLFQFNPFFDEILNAIDFGIKRLEDIEKLNQFPILLDPAKLTFLTFSTPKEIDLGDIKILLASLHTLRGVIYLIQSYQIVPDQFTQSGIIDGLTKGGSMLTLIKPTYTLRALSSFQTAAPLFLTGINLILKESDDQSNDLLPVDNDTRQFLNKAHTFVENARQLLHQDFTLFYGEVGSLLIDFPHFFKSPPKDLKELLPDYIISTHLNFNFAIQSTDFSTLNLPDYTYGGLFPEQTTKDAWEPFLNYAVCDNEYNLNCQNEVISDEITLCSGSCCSCIYAQDNNHCYCTGSGDDTICYEQFSYITTDNSEICLTSSLHQFYCGE